MGLTKRVLNVIASLIILALGVFMLLDPKNSYKLVVLLLMITLIVKGLRLLVYYFKMARHTVGGIVFLYQGVLLLDAGIFALSLDNVPVVYTMLYLIVCMLVAGGIDVMRSNQARIMETGKWKLQMVYGAGNIILSILGIIFIFSGTWVAIIYAVSLLHSGVCRMITAFRKTAVVYIGG